MDFITGLPEDGAMNAILVVVDRFSKIAHFILTTEEISARETAKFLLHNVWKLHGTLSDIVLDHGPHVRLLSVEDSVPMPRNRTET
jgi:hypothetical protein